MTTEPSTTAQFVVEIVADNARSHMPPRPAESLQRNKQLLQRNDRSPSTSRWESGCAKRPLLDLRLPKRPQELSTRTEPSVVENYEELFLDCIPNQFLSAWADSDCRKASATIHQLSGSWEAECKRMSTIACTRPRRRPSEGTTIFHDAQE